MEKIWLKNYPADVPKFIEEKLCTVHQLLEDSAKKFPGHTALIFFGKEVTYSELYNLADRFASSLYKLGIRKGDRIGIYLPNSPQVVIVYYAVLKLGGIVVQINPLYVERELIHQIKDSGIKALIYLDLLSKKVANVLNDVDIDILISTSIKDFLKFPYDALLKIKNLFQHQEVVDIKKGHKFVELIKEYASFPLPDINPKEDIALLQYTGGTTGLSKGVILTHNNLVSNVLQARAWFAGVKYGEEVVLSVLPFFHVFGMTVCMNLSILIGATSVILPKFELKRVLKTIARYKPTIFPGVPTIYSAINNHPSIGKYKLSSIKFCISGAAPLPMEISKEFEKLTGGRLVEGYGLTESSPITHCNPLYGKGKTGSIGLPLPSTDCKIVDIIDGVTEMKRGESGELILKGPQVMKGYWNKDEETKNVLRDGWLYTGDIAKMDEEGYFYIVDRKKDLIIRGGFNVYPREVEEVLYQHPKIHDVCVVGITDKHLGEIVKAYVVLKIGCMASEDEIKEFCKHHMAKYKVPSKVEFRAELPKNILGKVLKRVIKEEEGK